MEDGRFELQRSWTAGRRRWRTRSSERERAFEVGAFALDLGAAHDDLDFAGLCVAVFGYGAFAHVPRQRTFEALVLPSDFDGWPVLCDGDADVLRAHLIPDELPVSGECRGLRGGGEKQERQCEHGFNDCTHCGENRFE